MDLEQQIQDIYQQDSRRILATLIRLLRDFDLAEEAMQDAFLSAATNWKDHGVPQNPRSWLISTGRFKAIDRLRRQQVLNDRQQAIADRIQQIEQLNLEKADQDIEDDRLRLIFTCCHPAIDQTVQIPLTLREVCGLTTQEIASAFLTTPATMAQRIVRGKSKIREAGIPFRVPTGNQFAERLNSVLAVIYLVYNEGYSATVGDQLTRAELSQEAIRLGQLLVELSPASEAMGLLALMLIQESRREARSDAHGDLILLEDQDRSLWDQRLIHEGQVWLQRALMTRRFGTYTLQASIASIHAQADSTAQTDWNQIVLLYDALGSIDPSPVIQLNRAVAVAMRDGPQAGLEILDRLDQDGQLAQFHLLHAARADFFRRQGQIPKAKRSYEIALSLATQSPEIRFLQRRLRELEH